MSDVTTDPRLARRYEGWEVPDEAYRVAAVRMASFQCLAELVGVLPFAEWMIKAPEYVRSQMLIAKIQDEVGHGHVMARVAEDLGVDREEILWDFVEGRAKLLNIFHYGFETWEEIGPAALLMNSSAIVQFQSLDQGTYLPYARALKKVEKEEAFHYHHALDLTHELMRAGTSRQRALVQEAFDRWLPRLLAYFGPPDRDHVAENVAYQRGLKVDANDDLRERWLDRIIPVFAELGVRVPSDTVYRDDETGRWVYPSPDWDEVGAMLRNGGPRYQEWKDCIRGSLERNGAYRLAVLAEVA